MASKKLSTGSSCRSGAACVGTISFCFAGWLPPICYNKFHTSTKPVISVSNVSMRYGAKILFEEVSTAFLSGRRYGLTGPNGSGKSTFMKVLTGELDAQKGTVVRPKRVGVLSQDQFAFDEFRVIDTVIMGNRPLWAAFEERDHLYAKTEMTDEDGMRLGELEGVVAEN